MESYTPNFPALLIVLIACLFAGWWLLLADEYAQLGMHSGAGALSVANLVLWRDSGYFDGSAETMPLLHLWSLGVEEQFYIFWPLIIWRFRAQRLCVLLASLSLGGASLVFCLYQTASDPVAAFYSPVTRLWELAAGGALACRGPDEGKFPNGRNRMLSGLQVVVGLFLIGVASLSFAASDPFPGWRAVLPVLGASLVIAADGRSVVASRLLAHRVMMWFGLISFPLYLWHWPLLSFAQIIEGGCRIT